ncbi:MAG: hypothetical protein AAF289_10260, partial [Cyanobacteria bacterium P01_A01_bin.135]
DKEANFAFSNLSAVDFLKNPLRFNKEFKNTFWRSAYYKNLKSPVVKLYLRCTERYFLDKNKVFIASYKATRSVYRRWLKSEAKQA